jgi:hypothetical protein
MFTPGSGTCAYRTASGLGNWLSRDPINELGNLQLRRKWTQEDSGLQFSPTQESNLYRFAFNNPLITLDVLGLGEWTLSITPGDKFWFPGPVVDASWMAEEFDCCTCSSYWIRRYARPRYIGAIFTGTWREDGDITNPVFTRGYCVLNLPAHALDEPGGRVPLFGWVVPYAMDFRWEVICDSGPDKGELLDSTEATIVILQNDGAWVGPPPGERIIHD